MVRPLRPRQSCDSREPPVEGFGKSLAAILPVEKVLQLPPPDRRLDIGHVRLDARNLHSVSPAGAREVSLPRVVAHAVDANLPRVCGPIAVVGRYHSALPD